MGRRQNENVISIIHLRRRAADLRFWFSCFLKKKSFRGFLFGASSVCVCARERDKIRTNWCKYNSNWMNTLHNYRQIARFQSEKRFRFVLYTFLFHFRFALTIDNDTDQFWIRNFRSTNIRLNNSSNNETKKIMMKLICFRFYRFPIKQMEKRKKRKKNMYCDCDRDATNNARSDQTGNRRRSAIQFIMMNTARSSFHIKYTHNSIINDIRFVRMSQAISMPERCTM